MSIDVPVVEMKKAATAKDYNFIDTYAEFITEVIFKYENAVPESKHRHHRELQTHQQLQVICQLIATTSTPENSPQYTKSGYPDYTNNYSYLFSREFNRPPSLI